MLMADYKILLNPRYCYVFGSLSWVPAFAGMTSVVRINY